MFRPTRARNVAARFTLIAGAMLLGACAGDVTAPAAAPVRTSVEATSMFVPSAAAKALIGVADGTYVVTLDPKRDQSFWLGPNHLSMPANSICELDKSGYGAAFWDSSCKPERAPVTLTVVIKNATSSKPSIQFFPAMRFNPQTTVQLFMYAPHVSKSDAINWLMLYCPDKGKCVDESLTDAALTTYIDYPNNILFRRVKHFSGYTVAERADSLLEPILP